MKGVHENSKPRGFLSKRSRSDQSCVYELTYFDVVGFTDEFVDVTSLSRQLPGVVLKDDPLSTTAVQVV